MTRTTQLPIDPSDFTGSCPTWLHEMYGRAREVRKGAQPMPPGFWLTIGVLAHADLPEIPRDCSLDLPLGDLLGWLFPCEEIHDAEWGTFCSAFEEVMRYRVTSGNVMWWVVLGDAIPTHYTRGQAARFRARRPAAGMEAMAIDWPRLVGLRASGTLTCLYLSVQALLARERLLDRPAVLPDRHLASCAELADSERNRALARGALEQMQLDGLVRLERETNHTRIFG